MSLAHARLSNEALMCCVNHALSTEKHEVMGLLLGRWLVGDDGSCTADITHAMVMTRTDKRPDRVEV